METESKDVKSAEPALIRERCRSRGDCEARRGFCPRRLCPEYLAIGKLVSEEGLQLRDLGGKGGTDGTA